MSETTYQFTNNWFDTYSRQVWPPLLGQLQPQKVLEIGSYEGAGICFLIENSSTFSTSEIHCVDTWEGGIEHQSAGMDMDIVYQRFQNNVRKAIEVTKARTQVFIHRNFSDMALSALLTHHGKGYFDFIYVDGSHQAPDVLCDAVLAFRLLRVGGVLAFDDYLWAEQLDGKKDLLHCPKPAIDAFVNLYINKLEILQTPMYQLYVQKTTD
ncbi:class I SAM-dependent methyltransferase [Comamonas sp. Y33R10-2]|uniref:class I SAM-dependent methyltransferase n=1 Tax=Comamonas sp. Y33R10-2 TaxID=2853257 RepID=UPI001C5CAAA9|nr:class I SAM-dependent methyltransferase [Comamonas sp. Y33R10-2]QXZ09998.1 class I SAM-dependent methyltransferase [Comamonas sp. Y33R10-2]